MLAEFIEEGHFATHLRRMRDIYRERHEAFHDAAERRSAACWNAPRSAAGFHVTGRFVQSELDEDRRCRREPMPPASSSRRSAASASSRSPSKGLVLGVSAIDPRAIRKGVEVLVRSVLAVAVGSRAS